MGVQNTVVRMTANPSTRFRPLPAVLTILASLLLTGCSLDGTSPAPDAPGETDPSGAPAETEGDDETGAVGLQDTDFGNLTWQFRLGGSDTETQQIDMVDGAATDGLVTYEVGEVLHAELSGNDLVDAAVQITRIDGNAVEEQWYLWIAGEDGPVQSTYPIARQASCGSVIHSVTVVDGGIEIHESRRSVVDEAVPCSEAGTDERTRTVRAVEARSVGEWWPEQTAPIGGFGGLCPMTTHLDTYPNDAPLYAVPDAEAGGEIPFEQPAALVEIETWPVYDETFPGWVLTGIHAGDVRACAWAERA